MNVVREVEDHEQWKGMFDNQASQISNEKIGVDINRGLTTDNVIQLGLSSATRDLFAENDPSYFSIWFTNQPIRNVTRLQLAETIIPNTQFNVVRPRKVKWRFGTDPANIIREVTIDAAYMNEESLLQALSDIMSVENNCVHWTNYSGKARVTTDCDLILWPDLSGSDQFAVWDYVSDSFLRILGFDLGAGPVAISRGQTFTTPRIMDFTGSSYVLMRLLVNGEALGNLFEVDSKGTRVGPFFSRILLASGLGQLNFSNGNAVHTFTGPTTITSMTIELVQPIVGIHEYRYDMNGRDYIVNFVLHQQSIVTK